MAMIGTSASSNERTTPSPRRSVPSARPLVIGYAHDAKSGKAERAIRDGAHVIIWSFLHLDATKKQNKNGEEYYEGGIRTDLDLSEVRRIRDAHEHVVHLAAFGGWNGPHPPAGAAARSGQEWCRIFAEFNAKHGYLFDGVDWDYEGHDDLSAPTSKITIDTLDVISDFSVEAKKRYGFIVSMAPAESYLDATIETDADARFSQDLNLPPRAWSSNEDDREFIRSKGFNHAGRQCYAYLLERAGVETFDWISIQLYESYSPFVHEVNRKKVDTVDALANRIDALAHGYVVSNLPGEGQAPYRVVVPPSKLVLGVANSWADGTKVCKIEPSALRSAYDATKSKYGEGFLGVMFWTLEEEGDDVDSRLTSGLSSVFQISVGKYGDSKPLKDEF